MNNKQRITLGAIAISIGFSAYEACGNTSTHYDLFKTPASRMVHAYESFSTYVQAMHNDKLKKIAPSLSGIVHADSIRGITDVYGMMYADTTHVPVIDPEIEAAFLTMILEKFVTFYYKQLDILESAYMYWDWAQKHRTAYACSQFPTTWVSGVPNAITIEHNRLQVQQLRDRYNEQFGAIVRLLTMRHDTAVEVVTWISYVQSFLNTISADYKIQDTKSDDLSSGTLFAQKLLFHEKQIQTAVNKVKMPGWVQRNWLGLTTGAVATGVFAYWYMNNQQLVHDSVATTTNTLKNMWEEYFCNPVRPLKNEIVKVKNEIGRTFPGTSLGDGDPKIVTNEYEIFLKKHENGTIQTTDNVGLVRLDDESAWNLAQKARQEGLQDFNGSTNTTSSWWNQVPGSQYAQEKKNAVYKMLCGVEVDIQHIKHIVMGLLEDRDRLLEQNRFLFMMSGFIPAVTITGFTSFLGSKLFSWIRKKDRRMLRYRLCQVEDLLIRTEHDQLADDEYGRSLYLLMKEHEQVAKNVLSEEQDAFLEDLHYLVQSRPSVIQKKETLKTMWRKYQSLAASV